MIKRHKIASEKAEFILCAAIWVNDPEGDNPSRVFNVEKGYVFTGHRHWNCYGQISLHYGFAVNGKYPDRYHSWDKIQGFLTSKNRFVGRTEAAEIAYREKQISERVDILFSEDIY